MSVTFETIIVGVDGSDHGFEALRQALTLRPPNGVLHSITVVESRGAQRAGHVNPRLLALLVDEAEKTHEQAAALLEGHPLCDARVAPGDPLETLLAHAPDEHATLIAVGSHRHSRTVGMLLGSTSTGLLHNAPCSVLVARINGGHVWVPQRILVGVDGSPYSLAALATADELAARLGAEVTVLAATGGKQIESEGAWAARVDKWTPGHPVVNLLDQSLHANLVILGSRGLHGLRALGSVSERVAHRAHCSVLVVRVGVEPNELAGEPAEATTQRKDTDER